MSRRKFVPKKSKYEDETLLAKGVITKIEYKNQIVNDKFKSVFYVPSYLCPEGRMCVMWGHANFNAGDEIEMKGRLNDGVFLCWSMQITKRAEQNDNRTV